MCSPPRAATTNHHTPDGLQLQKILFYSSRGQKPEITQPAGPHSLQSLYGRILPCVFQLPMPAGAPWLVAASLPFATSTFACLSSLRLPVSSPFLPLIRTLLGCRAHPKSVLISSADPYLTSMKALLPNQVIFLDSRWNFILGWGTPLGK